MSKIEKDLGASSAYAYAVQYGEYTGTEEEYGQEMADLANISAEAETLSPDEEASASYSGGVLSFGVPRGVTGNGISSAVLNSDFTLTLTFTDGTTYTTPTPIRGATGATPSISATASTLPEGSSASVSVTGTTENPVINFGIPKGDTGYPTDAQVQSAVDEWYEEHPEGIVPDGSLTEAKFTSATLKKVINDYITPEMYGAIGDGITDDTDAIQTMIASGGKYFEFSEKTYLVKSGLDFIGDGLCIIFNNTTIYALAPHWTTPLEYVVKFSGKEMCTVGRLNVKHGQSALIGIMLEKVGGSTFDSLYVEGALLWGIYMSEENKLYNNGISYHDLTAHGCGFSIPAKGKYVSSSELAITDIDYAGMQPTRSNIRDSDSVARNILTKNYQQITYLVDDSDYVKTIQAPLQNRLVFMSNSDYPLTLDAEDRTKGTFTASSGYAYIPNDYVDGDGGRDLWILVGGAIRLGARESGGVFNIDYLAVASSSVGLYVEHDYGGTIGSCMIDTCGLGIATRINLWNLTINYLYMEAIGHLFTKATAYPKALYLVTPNSNAKVVVGTSQTNIVRQNVVICNQQFNQNPAVTLYLAKRDAFKLVGINVSDTSDWFHGTVNERTCRDITINTSGGLWSNKLLTLDLIDTSVGNRQGGFTPLRVFVRNTFSGSGKKSFTISLTNALINLGFTINGAINNVLTIDGSNLGNNFVVTVLLFGNTFYATAEALTFVDNT